MENHLLFKGQGGGLREGVAGGISLAGSHLL